MLLSSTFVRPEIRPEIFQGAEVEERLAREAKKDPNAFYRYASGRSQHSIGSLMKGGS